MEGQGKPFNGDTHMQDEFLRLKKKHGIERVIETGTFHGDTTAWLSDNFDFVRTIEFDRTRQNLSLRKLRGRANVELFNGDSSKDLAKMLKGFTGNLLIFLDAHWFANPVLAELKQIAEAGITPVLAIHDFYNPNDPTMGFDQYPDQGIKYEYSWIEPSLKSIYGDNFAFHYNKVATGARRGCIFVYPKTKRS